MKLTQAKTAVAAVLLLLPQVATAADDQQALDSSAALAKIQAATANVKKLFREYESSNDQLILKCIRKNLTGLQAIEAAALATAAKLAAARAGELRDSAAATLAEQVQTAATLEAAAMACLRVQSGEIVTYSNEQAQPAGELPAEVPTPGVSISLSPPPPDRAPAVEPEPRDAPVSNVELP